MKKTVIAIVGPTAVGKTKLSIEIAKRFNGEIISGDSMQIYKGMNIGTAKITTDEMQGIPHHMIDIKNADETFSAADFQYYVRKYVDEITARQKLPIIVGGSGLYIQAALYDYNFSVQKKDDSVTKKLEEIVEAEGITPLYSRLKDIDPVQAEKIHPNNHRRVIRALEIYETTGLTMSKYQEKQDFRPVYNSLILGLEMDRELLYDRINKRIDSMLDDGLLDEVKQMYQAGYGNKQSMKAIGYKEFIPYLDGEQSIENSIEILKRNSRRYAKRQYTWFRNKMDITWYTITPDSMNERFGIILEDLAGFLENT
ncbi:tRNA (adenosine(37)-N6)-dimethylallyltransferase MiaA [Virgibacillus profundi]|uniref:tRNA dimethylallyltransferase n=1 Tax=Virgibacillus profundi TaxID=2024555 RepID=A0A2A2IG10_9BACI|nr:tRNA (adenosine(37)-N6)-dimethylallyltransferase MiaA [Virgibacillus profundi]PAV30080.1 tRNA (adenosine(37)-N6)-dimethylallyltransferase MiaA [Virgibacillus profundi]PXY54253.1 tRNA (adenosine(37)-N6)-dimethylallyltransferase MiaA [Virgibacillus profundi]